MRTKNVKVEPQLNKFLWSRGCRAVPRRVRVKLSKKRDEDEESEGFYTLAEHVPVSTYHGLVTEIVEDDE